MVRIIQQRVNCIGCNACVEAAAYRWRVSKRDGKCTLVGGINKRGFYSIVVGDDELEDNERAARNCPMNIIQVQKI